MNLPTVFKVVTLECHRRSSLPVRRSQKGPTFPWIPDKGIRE